MKTLIIKIGASGDVVRTTVLLRELQGEIWWLTDEYNIDILPAGIEGLNIFSIQNVQSGMIHEHFDLIINLEEDGSIAKFAKQLNTHEYVGPYYEGDKLVYTSSAAPWFDMSLISVYGRDEANQIKMANRRSYQEILLSMIAKFFVEQPYFINSVQETKIPVSNTVGIETRVGKRWPNKQWYAYHELADKLKSEGYATRVFERRKDLKEYMRDVRQCSMIISGDSLAMHLALAYQKPCLGIFNCTSPFEIFDYGLLAKAVSPRLNEFYYDTSFNREAIEALKLEDIFLLAKKLLS